MNERQERPQMTDEDKKLRVKVSAYLIVLEDSHHKDKEIRDHITKRDQLEKEVTDMQQKFREQQKELMKEKVKIGRYLSDFLPKELKEI